MSTDDGFMDWCIDNYEDLTHAYCQRNIHEFEEWAKQQYYEENNG